MGTEADAIASSDEPVTRASIAADLSNLGISRGEVAIVHASLSALGWVVGGAQSVVEALFEAVGPDGTIVMPAQSGQLTDPSEWSMPPVPDEWYEEIRATMPAFDASLTPSRGMGAVAECFRALPSTVRSSHPHLSFTAHGPRAAEIVAEHALNSGFGERSPLARLYELNATVLLLGANHDSNTSLHLAESRAEWGGKEHVPVSGPVMIDGERRWETWTDLDYDEDDFEAIGDAFAATGAETSGPVGYGIGRRCAQRTIVDFAVDWIVANR